MGINKTIIVNNILIAANLSNKNYYMFFLLNYTMASYKITGHI